MRQRLEQGDHLARQRHDLWRASFISAGGNDPQALLEIELIPTGIADVGQTLARHY